MPDPDADGDEYVDLSVTVEIVTGEVIDAIYQIYPVENLVRLNGYKTIEKRLTTLQK